MEKYSKTQYGILLNIIFLGVILFTLYAYYYQIGTNPLPFLFTLILVGVFVFILLLFYKLTITIDAEKIVATFGIGLIKKEVLLKDIDINSIEKIKMPWYYGIGVRLTPKGWLYNIKVGEAIYFKTTKNSFLVGTDDFETIENILKA